MHPWWWFYLLAMLDWCEFGLLKFSSRLFVYVLEFGKIYVVGDVECSKLHADTNWSSSFHNW